ncbi:glutathione S-transferase family protein [Kiloniella laminariae]|uniref:Glutathione S-transferase family protein n=1 Tax=Kiloniella laminariae TaxID=454162 RepID=A0ABT4LF11_9PROT|nr:glutathione S-transferase family protein [Kiloniella laminariae]MCZ4279689.1 glutathione S-transferase family protein [Kiloniella laminariae]
MALAFLPSGFFAFGLFVSGSHIAVSRDLERIEEARIDQNRTRQISPFVARRLSALQEAPRKQTRYFERPVPMLTLFHTPGACSQASRIALEEAGADYQVQLVSFATGDQHKAEYLAINPRGRVPALATENGILTETPAILLYIAQRFPEAALAPLQDIFALAQAQSFNSFISSTLHVAHAHGRRGNRWADDPGSLEDMKRKVPETVAAAFTQIEENLFKGPWVLGENYSICDGYLHTVAGWMESDGITPTRFPRLLDHRRRMEQRPALQRLNATENL